MSLMDKLHNIYPDVTPLEWFQHVRLVDNGEGPFIATWTLPGKAQPTAQQIAAADDTPYTQTPAYIAEEARLASYDQDAGQLDLLNRLRTATPAQIDTWLTNNVTNLAQARAVLGHIIKLLVARRFHK